MPFCNKAEKSNAIRLPLFAAICVVLLSLAPDAHAKVVYVSAGQITNSPPNGLSWNTAFATVQEGVNAAITGDEVRVAAAIYPENITLKNGIVLYGGFAGTETNLTQRNWSNNVTILDGRRTNSVVLVQPGAGTGTRIDGFTIRNGFLSGSSDKGGGILCSNASPVVANNIISSNSAPSGGGIYCYRSAAVITNNWIAQNSGFSGGGIYCLDSSATIAHNVISGNRGAAIPAGFGLGGGVYCGISSGISSDVITLSHNVISENSAESGGGVECNTAVIANISHNTFAHNQAASYGGGIECYGSSPTVRNNRFIGNAVTRSVAGGAISVFTLSGPGASPRIVNNVFLGNTGRLDSGSQGGGIYCSRLTRSAIINNTFAGNLAKEGGGIFTESDETTIANNLIAFGSSGLVAPLTGTTNNCIFGNESGDFIGTGTHGNISVDPKFSENLRLGDVHLLPSSPCRDAGHTPAADPAWTDVDGQTRIQGASVDIGADESDGTVSPVGPVVVRVSPTGDDRNAGSSWAFAKRTVQGAIEDVSGTGGEVWVRAGTYAGRISLKSLVYLYGGFSGTETNRSQRNWTVYRTVLDGNRQGSVITAMHTGPWTALDGFTIENGQAQNGGGIFCTNASPSISNNVIRANLSTNGSGGGIYLNGSSSVMANNRFEGNLTTGDGGGIFITARLLPAAKIINNVFVGNAATNDSNSCRGGAIHCDAAAEIIHNTMLNNWARTGAALATDHGGGIFCNLSGALLANNIIAFGSSGIRVQDAVPFLQNNCVFGNLAFNYAGMSDPTGLNGNISADPFLVNSNDVHLSTSSPCINAGDNSVVLAVWLDLDGQPRILGRVDIGADEAQVAFLSAQRPGAGPTRVHVDGPPGTHYTLQAATNLQNWQTISTNFSVPFDFTDPASTNLPSRFYRALMSP
ncbi:MAG TPA: right-handed parallel beta-helix repeat-containing protein [Verrucomicrobiae bacterium]|nr:right-handed parallel beta-helix repeat-containing protein [Verrucomicrobiae bacterium]